MADEQEKPPTSPRIEALKDAIAAGDTSAEATFWAEIAETGSPLVEPHPERKDARLVTFLWKDRPDVGHVTLMHFFLGRDATEADRLKRIEGTGVHALTMEIHSAMRALYQLAPDEPLEPLTPANWETRSERWLADPLNPRQFRRTPGDPDKPRPPDSLLELPDAVTRPYDPDTLDLPGGTVTPHPFRSEILDNEREIFVYTPAGFDAAAGPYPLLLHFDAQWRDVSMELPATLDWLIGSGRIVPTVAVFISNVDRGAELPCNADYARAMATELVPWLREHYAVTDDPSRIAAAGQSYGGLAAMWFGLVHPETFGCVLSQSGSYWWYPGFSTDTQLLGDAPQGEWLTSAFATRPHVPVRIWMNVGVMEVGNTRFPYTANLTLSNRHLRQILNLRGYDVTYEEYVGGHDFITWRDTIHRGLEHFIAPGRASCGTSHSFVD
jgi:enterochelin esterase family protein